MGLSVAPHPCSIKCKLITFCQTNHFALRLYSTPDWIERQNDVLLINHLMTIQDKWCFADKSPWDTSPLVTCSCVVSHDLLWTWSFQTFDCENSNVSLYYVVVTNWWLWYPLKRLLPPAHTQLCLQPQLLTMALWVLKETSIFLLRNATYVTSTAVITRYTDSL